MIYISSKFIKSLLIVTLGTDEERGILKWNAQFVSEEDDDDKTKDCMDTYDFPFGMNIIRR